MEKLDNTFLNNQWIKEEVTRKIRKYLQGSENENTTYQNLWNVAKVVLWGKCTAINTLKNKKGGKRKIKIGSKNKCNDKKIVTHGKCSSSYINNHFKCEWSKHTN